jgi:cation diffusion facilitator family transporter
MSPAAHPTSNVSTSNLQSGARIALLGMAINAVLATVKITAGLLGNSYALIADGIESALDIGGSAIIWGGLKFAARPPDATHPYGHGKAEPVAAAVVACGVLAAAVLLAVQSVREIFIPHDAPAPFTLAVLVVVVVVKELLYRSVIRLGRDVESTAVQTDAWHHRSDALTSIAAFLGISIALLGGEGWESADGIAALFACALIAFNGLRLLAPALHEIMDTAPRGEMSDAIRVAAAGVPGVLEVEKCLVRKMGLHFYVDLHVGVDESISVRDGHDIAHEVKNAIQVMDPRIADALVHVEPAAVVRAESTGAPPEEAS